MGELSSATDVTLTIQDQRTPLFAMIYADVLMALRGNGNGVHVYAILALHARTGRSPELRLSTLAEETGYSVRTVQRVCKELEAVGVLRRVAQTRTADGGRAHNLYVLVDPPSSAPEVIHTPVTDLSGGGDRSVGGGVTDLSPPRGTDIQEQRPPLPPAPDGAEGVCPKHQKTGKQGDNCRGCGTNPRAARTRVAKQQDRQRRDRERERPWCGECSDPTRRLAFDPDTGSIRPGVWCPQCGMPSPGLESARLDSQLKREIRTARAERDGRSPWASVDGD